MQASVAANVFRKSPSRFKKTCFASAIPHPMTGICLISALDKYLKGRGMNPESNKMSKNDV